MNKHICKAKSMYDGSWVYGYYIAVPCDFGGGVAHLIIEPDAEYKCSGEFSWDHVRSVDPNTVCRCIGWHDSHKTPIFERDVVELSSQSHSHRHLIWWSNEMNMMDAVPLDGIEFNGWDYWNGKYPQFKYSDFCFMMQDPYGDFSEIKVVGNIVDSPELLEVQNETSF